MTVVLSDVIKPVLERVSAEQVEFVNRGNAEEVCALVYGFRYVFRFGMNGEHEECVVVERCEHGRVRKSYFFVEEIEMLEHINMPYLDLVEIDWGNFSLPEQRVSDVSLRLHLIMERDIYSVEELVTYVGAGTQRATNYYRAHG